MCEARSRIDAGNAAISLSCAADTASPSPRSAAGPGSPARNSDSASCSVSPVSRVR